MVKMVGKVPGQYGKRGGTGTQDLKVPLGSGKERFPDPKGKVSRRKGSQERLIKLNN